MLIEYLYGKIIFIIFATVCSLSDAGKKKVDIHFFIIMLGFTFGGYAWMLASGEEVLWLRLGIGLLSAGAMWLISYFTKQQLGYGDAMYFTCTALVLACKNILLILGTFILSALASLVLILIYSMQRRSRKLKDTTLPLIPFSLPIALLLCACTTL